MSKLKKVFSNLKDANQNFAGKLGIGPERSSKGPRPVVTPMPDEEAIEDARRRRARMRLGSGRESTIYTDSLG